MDVVPASCLGGVQPGDGTKALLGSAAGAGAMAIATGGAMGAGAAGASAVVLATGTGADADAMPASWPGGVQPGGGTKARLGSAGRAMASGVAVEAPGTGGAIVATSVTTVGAATDRFDAGEVATGVAASAGGVQPGGGTKARLGSAGRGEATAIVAVAGAGDSVSVNATGADATAGTIDTGAFVGAEATRGAGGVPGGAQPGGGMNALLGSAGGAGGVAGSGRACGAGAAGGTGSGSATGAGTAGASSAGGVLTVGGAPLGASDGVLPLASFSAAVRACRCSRDFASRSAASFSTASFWAFWPPLAGTTEPICAPPRVSSSGANPESYWRPELAAGRLALAGTWASAPGRAFAIGTGAFPPHPARIARVDTPTRPNQRRRLPIVSLSRCIVVTRLKLGSLIF